MATSVRRTPYTGDEIAGIGLLHKSNLVPVRKDSNDAKEIARMRLKLIEDIRQFWQIDESYAVADTFTGYEDLYAQLDKYTKETYGKDPDKTIDSVFNIYRNRGIVPIDYYTESGLVVAIRKFMGAKYNSLQGRCHRLGNTLDKK